MSYSYIIYKLTFPNNKVYIGQTVQEFDSYMNQYKRNAYNKNLKRHNNPIYRAIRKYGWDNVKKEILFTTSEEFVDELETKMIAEYNATDKRFGYNILEIGESRKGFRHSEKTKKKQSKIKTGKYAGKNNPMWRKHHSKESNEKNRQSHLGKKLSEEHIRNVITGLQKSTNAYNKKSILCFNKITNIFFKKYPSITHAGIELNINLSHISAVCKGKRNSAGGYTFKYLI